MSEKEISMEEQSLCSHKITETPVKLNLLKQEKYEYSEEEKQAIEEFKEVIKEIENKVINSRYTSDKKFYAKYSIAYRIILNLIEKQQKEIERLKTKCKGLEIDLMLEEKENEPYKSNLTDKDYISKQVIRDKIEEYQKELEINKDNVMYQKLIYTSKEVIREEIQALKELLGENND